MTVAVLSPGRPDEPGWRLFGEIAAAAARDLDIRLEIHHAEHDDARLGADGRAVLHRADLPDYLVVVDDGAVAGALVAEAEAVGVNTVLVMSNTAEAAAILPDPGGRFLGTTGADDRAAGGHLARHLVAALAGGPGVAGDGRRHVLALTGRSHLAESHDRVIGLYRALDGGPVTVDRRVCARGRRAEAATLVRDWLDACRHQGIPPAGIWAGDDPATLGALDALGAAGLVGLVPLVGIACGTAELAALRGGGLAAAGTGHFLAGALALVLVRDHYDGGAFGRELHDLHFPTPTLTAADADRYGVVFEGADWRRIGFQRFLPLTAANADRFRLETWLPALVA